MIMRLVATRFSLVILGIFLLQATASPAAGRTGIPDDFLKEARKLRAIEMDYFQKRLTSDWPAIYDYHHPKFRENVSIEEFKFFQGRVVYNFRQAATLHVSGFGLPTREYIKNHPAKKDILGFPVPPKYQMFGDPLITPKSLVIDKIAVSRDKRFAKVEGRVMGREQLNPAIVRGHIEFPVTIAVVDFWEKVDGRWVITLLKDISHISGHTRFYYIPNNNDGWEQMEFVEIDASLVTADER
ncbi:MAG: hypothetical protein ACE5G9_06110 [Nitrospinales bacterium]